MPSLYSDLTDEQLAAKIVQFRDAQDELALGGGVAVIAGEGRRIEYTRSQSGKLASALIELLAERDRRGGTSGGALPIWIRS